MEHGYGGHLTPGMPAKPCEELLNVAKNIADCTGDFCLPPVESTLPCSHEQCTWYVFIHVTLLVYVPDIRTSNKSTGVVVRWPVGIALSPVKIRRAICEAWKYCRRANNSSVGRFSFGTQEM